MGQREVLALERGMALFAEAHEPLSSTPRALRTPFVCAAC